MRCCFFRSNVILIHKLVKLSKVYFSKRIYIIGGRKKKKKKAFIVIYKFYKLPNDYKTAMLK